MAQKMTYHRAKYLLETRTMRESHILREDDWEVIPEKSAVLELWNDEIEAIDLAIAVLNEKMRRSERYRKKREVKNEEKVEGNH